MPTFGSLFAGIGGIDLGLERAGWECRFQVEWDPFCQRVLAKHWPDVPRYGDIREVHGPLAHADGLRRDGPSGQSAGPDGEPHNDEFGARCPRCLPTVDLLAGGFPCQPVSFAGRRAITDDDRWLWPEFARTIRELRPRYVLVENVPGLLVGGGMDEVLGGLAELGYDTEWESIPAAAVGAPHLRYRVWIVAYAARAGLEGHWGPSEGCSVGRAGHDAPAGGGGYDARPLADAERRHGEAQHQGRLLGEPGSQGSSSRSPDGYVSGDWQWSAEPDVGRVAHGVPARVDRLRSLGNAVVPQVVEFIGRRILEAEAERVA